jgi:hypothetical protein
MIAAAPLNRNSTRKLIKITPFQTKKDISDCLSLWAKMAIEGWPFSGSIGLVILVTIYDVRRFIKAYSIVI